VPATEVLTSYIGTTPVIGGQNPILATINPASDLLVASVAVVKYQVSVGTTCAPDCDNPWRSGDPWPLPSPSSQTEPNIRGDQDRTTLAFTYIFGIAFGCAVFGPLIYWGVGCLVKRLRGTSKPVNLGAEQKIPLERWA